MRLLFLIHLGDNLFGDLMLHLHTDELLAAIFTSFINTCDPHSDRIGWGSVRQLSLGRVFADKLLGRELNRLDQNYPCLGPNAAGQAH